MEQLINNIEDSLYAGVLGKTIGVYMGRPVEGWSYPRIRDTFGEISDFVHDQVGSEVVEVDDDLSGTFTFVNVLNDIELSQLTSKVIGEYWLNQIIENKTIFWWGGYYRSTEHTAYLNLKNGIEAPDSGSMRLNGKVCAEQIGSQIFIDGWGLINLGNPQNAKRCAIQAARVSHDGIAVSMAAFIAILESIVFEEKDIKKAIKKTCDVLNDSEVENYVNLMISICDKASTWREVRDVIELNYGYDKFKGNCPIVTNFLAILMSLLMNDNSFLKAISIATSCGWDTDCNAGNVGCIEGVRLGLKEIYKYPELLNKFNEKLYVVNAEAGSVNQDTTSVANNLLNIRKKIYNDCVAFDKKFNFNFYGSSNGFYSTDSKISGSKVETDEIGLHVEVITEASIKRDVYYFKENHKNSGYELIQSPQVYPGQTIETKLSLKSDTIKGRFIVEIVDENEKIIQKESELIEFKNGESKKWKIPGNKGYPIISIELKFISEKIENVVVNYIDYYGNPDIEYLTTFEMTPNYLTGHEFPTWYRSFCSTSNENAVDHLSTFCISSSQENGSLYIGTKDWKDYTIKTCLVPVRSYESGIIFRIQGLRKYYALMFNENQLSLVCKNNNSLKTLDSCWISWKEYDEIDVRISVKGNQMHVEFNEYRLSCLDETYTHGGCGFTTSKGTLMVKGLNIIGDRTCENI